MAYQVDKFNGQFLVSVGDGTIDTTTDLRLVGKNYAGYGELQNENFVHLMENFANTTPPPKAITGQIWYDSGLKKLRYFDGSRFKVAGGAEAGPTAPAGLAVGEFWWDTVAKQLYAWSGAEFELIGPEASPEFDQSIVAPAFVEDTFDITNPVIKVITGGKTVAVFSQSEFTIKNTELNRINGFEVIKKGLTLAETNQETGVSPDGYVFWGTAQNANSLGGVPADQFIRSGDVVFNQETRFQNPGYTVGNQNDLRVRIEPQNNNDAVIENRLGNDIVFKISNTPIIRIREIGVIPAGGQVSLGTQQDPWASLHASSIFGNLTGNVLGNTAGIHRGNVVSTTNDRILIDAEAEIIGFEGCRLEGTLNGTVIGTVEGTADSANRLINFAPEIQVPSSSNKESVVVRDAAGDVFARNFVGIATQADTFKVGASYRAASIGKIGDTVAARNSAGNLAANVFDGTATAARYADLAEKYLADQNYEVGTVVVVGGSAEVTACSAEQRAVGVVSDKPAFMMNSELEGGTYIALKGRVPIKVTGSVAKGDYLMAHYNGTAIKSDNALLMFAVALESNNSKEIKLVEALVL